MKSADMRHVAPRLPSPTFVCLLVCFLLVVGGSKEGAHPGSHFLCRLVGKGNRKDVSCRYAFLLNEVHDAMGEGFCFPTSGAGNDKHGTFGCFDGAALFGVEVVIEGSHGYTLS